MKGAGRTLTVAEGAAMICGTGIGKSFGGTGPHTLKVFGKFLTFITSRQQQCCESYREKQSFFHYHSE